jgi:CRISPR-associated protein Csd2
MNHRYDFIYLFDATDANPNGDPDAGNLPRVDTESGQGLITDVCIKRKVRNFIELTKKDATGFDIYIKEKAVLNLQHLRAYKACNLKPESKKLPKEVKDAGRIKDWMCSNFFDIRAFGAVMTTDVNCGQVRGSIQLGFSRSIDPIIVSEHAITRMAVTTEREAESQQGDNRTMGRKFTVPYALYRSHGFVNPFLAEQTGFSEDDLEIFFNALENAFQFDQSAARPAGSMAPRGLLVFKHEGTDSNPEQRAQQAKLGCAPSHTLFDRLAIESFEDRPEENGKPARKFSDYAKRITFDGKPLDEFMKAGGKQNEKGQWEKPLGNGITLIRRI